MTALHDAEDGERRALAARFSDVRRQTLALAAPLSAEDQLVQSMPDASPTKWHLAHTTWFFETFVLAAHASSYRPFDPSFGYLFNSYYEAIGPRHPRPERGLISRPGLDHVRAYRAHVDEALAELIASARPDVWRRIAPIVELGIQHEQQHQELILMDIKHAFAQNPLAPRYHDAPARPQREAPPLAWSEFPGGLYEIGHDGGSFAFDNEGPRHRVWLEPFRLANRLVSNAEYADFIADGGYGRAEFWLSDGWSIVNEKGWRAPLYWRGEAGDWREFTLAGERALDAGEPVCHLSYFEADAYARWAGGRLPREAEWEVAAMQAPRTGRFASSGEFHPAPASDATLQQMLGDVWEWTASPYTRYPGFRAAPGALGEYNGKFMCGQFVLRGGSAVTPDEHVRTTYRNFFPPPRAGLSPDSDSPMKHNLQLSAERRFEFIDLGPTQQSFERAVLAGLGRRRKAIPCRFLYDERGSELFERICELPEYYLTRAESGILRAKADAIAADIGGDACLVELGSGSSTKTRIVLDALTTPAAYVPIDISRDHLRAAALDVADDYPELRVIAICADYAAPLMLPDIGRRRVAFFPGSTIGNLTRKESVALLSAWRRLLGPGGRMILGADLRKTAARLEAAYNDKAGVTESFIKNVLVRINAELDGDVDIDGFAYEARYAARPGRVEMHLRSRRAQTLRIAGRDLPIAAGERIHIENSHKFSLKDLHDLARAAGFRPCAAHCDAERLFSVSLWATAD